MDLRLLASIFFLIIQGHAYGQENISNQQYFDSFYDQDGKNLLLLGENHSSSVASVIYPELVKSLNKKTALRTLFIEFEPSEAYFYSRYLSSGDEKFLAYTIYGGFYTGWKEAWEKILAYNQTLEQPLKIVGIDFDRTRTFGYCLYNIFKPYREAGIPKSIDSLLNVIKDEKFFKTYTIDHPSDEGKLFVKNTKILLENNIESIQEIISKEDMKVVQQLLKNEAIGFGGTREKDIKKNIVNHLNYSNDKNFLLLAGRDHAYIKPLYGQNVRLAKLLKAEKSINTLTGVILHENSKQWNQNYKETINLFEVKDKTPWNHFQKSIYKQIISEFSLIELKDELNELSVYTDYILVAKNQGAIKI